MNLKDHFVIAMPNLDDEIFSRSVVYICEHNRDGAMGLIINKPLDELTVQTVLSKLDINPYKNCLELNQPIFLGGPLVEEQGFILHTPQEGFASSIKISDDVMITTSLDILKTIGSPEQPLKLLVALGYASWSAFQLEGEIMRNDWLVAPANPDILFTMPTDERWHQAAQSIGVNLNTLSPKMGRA